MMEGKGMLMLDGVTGGPSHTMWVIRPAPYSSEIDGHVQDESLGRPGLAQYHKRSTSDPSRPFAPITRFSTEAVLCRICERPTPAWFFEKHNETCNETHRLESDINECNERLKEIARTIDDISTALDVGDATAPAEYRGIPLLLPLPTPTPPSYLQGLRPPLSPKPQPLQIRKTQHRILDQVAEITQTALTISTPSVLDEAGDVPIQEQRLLSPTVRRWLFLLNVVLTLLMLQSENKLAVVMRWQRPVAEEAALVRLITDTEEQTRFKLNSVNRLRNTILYAEKVRQEWEAKASATLSKLREEPWDTDSPLFDSPQLQPILTEDSSKISESLELPRPNSRALSRRYSSQLLDAMSPNLSPVETTSPGRLFGSLSNQNLAMSPRIPSGVPSSRTKASSIKDFKVLKPISKGACASSLCSSSCPC